MLLLLLGVLFLLGMLLLLVLLLLLGMLLLLLILLQLLGPLLLLFVLFLLLLGASVYLTLSHSLIAQVDRDLIIRGTQALVNSSPMRRTSCAHR